MIKEGDTVVCIDDSFHERVFDIIPYRPVKDRMYTVREIHYHNVNDKVGVLLNEIHNPPVLSGVLKVKLEPTFNIIRFAPIDDMIKSVSLEQLEEAVI
jgi:hypothetical protein